jgi:hypothetical protein
MSRSEWYVLGGDQFPILINPRPALRGVGYFRTCIWMFGCAGFGVPVPTLTVPRQCIAQVKLIPSRQWTKN